MHVILNNDKTHLLPVTDCSFSYLTKECHIKYSASGGWNDEELSWLSKLAKSTITSIEVIKDDEILHTYTVNGKVMNLSNDYRERGSDILLIDASLDIQC